MKKHIIAIAVLLCGFFAAQGQTELFHGYANIASRAVVSTGIYDVTLSGFTGGYKAYPDANWAASDLPVSPTDYVMWGNCVRFKIISRISTTPFVIRVQDPALTGALVGTDLVGYRVALGQETSLGTYRVGFVPPSADGNAGAFPGIAPADAACIGNYYKVQADSAIMVAGASGVNTFEGRSGTVVSASGDYTASEITNVPSGGVAAVTAQAAINELDGEKLSISNLLTGILAIDGTGSGIDADLLDGQSGAYYLAWGNLTGVPSTFTPSAHTHPVADITGILPMSKGGTGLGTLGTANQLLRMNAGATALEYFTPSYLTANQTITLSGDLTGSGTTAITATLGTDVVDSTNAAGLSITDIRAASGKLFGRASAGTGAGELITVGSGLSLSAGGVLTASGTLSGSGTTNYLPKWTGSTALGTSQLLNDANGLAIVTGSPLNANIVLFGEATKAVAGRNNTGFGRDVFSTGMLSNTDNNTAIGDGVMAAISGNAADQNTGVGASALAALTTGYNNTAIGYGAASGLTTGGGNVALGVSMVGAPVTGSLNLGIGSASLGILSSGNSNIAIGASALRGLSTGSYNVRIGADPSASSYNGDNSVFIGYSAGFFETGNNKLYIENSGATSPLIGGDFSSDFVGINRPVSGLANTLEVGGNILSTGVVKLSDGSASAPAMTYTADLNTGLFRPASDVIAFATGATERMRVNASGYVGIGTTGPGVPLEVSGTAVDGASIMKVSGSLLATPVTQNDGVVFSITGAGSSSASTPRAFRVDMLPGYTGPNNTLALQFSNTSAGANYNLGVSGVAGGTAKNIGMTGFAVNGTTNIGGYFALQNGPAGAGTQSAALIADNAGGTTNPVFIGKVNSTETFRISPTGNVNIGGAATSAAWPLTVAASESAIKLTSTGTANVSRLLFGETLADNVWGAHVYRYGSTHGTKANFLEIGQGGNNPIVFTTTAGTERMRITGAGLVGIGDVPTYPLDVTAPSGDYTMRLKSATAQNALLIQSNTTGATASDGLQFGTTGTTAYIWNREADVLQLQAGTNTAFQVWPSGASQLIGMTATAASALTPAVGMLIFVTTTDATFTSAGFWGYDGTGWTKLN